MGSLHAATLQPAFSTAKKARSGETAITRAAVLGSGSSLVPTPSKESELIGPVENLRRCRRKACRFLHGALFFRPRCLGRAKVHIGNLPAPGSTCT
eukprot:scaffold9998_cov63-Phaeocystis_antarctica.AAC.3